MDDNWLNQVLQANKNKSFVRRMYDANPKTLDLGDGNHATHRMAWTTVDNQHIAYPTVLWNGTNLVGYDPKQALDQVMKSGNYIPFKSPEEADFFSKNYKKVLKNKMFL